MTWAGEKSGRAIIEESAMLRVFFVCPVEKQNHKGRGI